MTQEEARRTELRFRVRHRGTWYGLPEGDFFVGRSPECQLRLNDPRVSRRHACFRVQGHRVTLEDLRSRNGTLVNGVPLRAPMVLSHDDLVTIGSQELRVTMTPDSVVVLPGERSSVPGSAPGEITIAGGLPPLIGLLDRALHAGKQEEAEQILEQFYRELDNEWRARARHPSAAVVESITRITLTHATLTSQCQWLDQLFALYHRLRLVMSPALIDDVSALLLLANHPPSPYLREYSEWLHGEVDNHGPSERFAHERLEQLLRTLRVS